MPLLLSPEQDLIKNVVREFAQKDLAEEATAIDRAARFPRDHYEKMAPLGLLGLLLPAEAGGSGTDTLSYAVAVEEVARASGTDAAMLIIQNALVAPLLHTAAGHESSAPRLAATVAGSQVGAVALTEEASGSSWEDLLTVAGPHHDGYRLDGAKAFVAPAGAADFYLVLARVPDDGPVVLLVPKDAEGLHFSPSESKLGLRGLPLANMYLNRVALPADARLPLDDPLGAIRDALNMARLGVGAGLVGLTQAALEGSIDFARGRIQFGRPIIEFGAIRGFLADVQAELEAARATVYGAAALRDANKPFEEEVLEGRLLAHRAAVNGTRIAHKVHGGAGFMRDLPVERVSRDVRTLMHLWDAQDITRSRLADRFLR